MLAQDSKRLQSIFRPPPRIRYLARAFRGAAEDLFRPWMRSNRLINTAPSATVAVPSPRDSRSPPYRHLHATATSTIKLEQPLLLELIASRRCNSGIRRYLYESYCSRGGWLPFQVLHAGCSLTFESPTHNRMQRRIIWTLATRQKS